MDLQFVNSPIVGQVDLVNALPKIVGAATKKISIYEAQIFFLFE